MKYLLRQAAASDALVTLPRAGGGWQPLCAVYRKTFAAIAERSLLQGRNKIDPLFADIKTLVLEERELARRGFSPDLFRNVNTPEELNDAKRQRANKK